MSISVEEVRYLARLARLRFPEAEEPELAERLGAVLDYMAKLDELDTTAVPPMTHVLDLTNVTREDEVEVRISREEALAQAPGADEAFFRVPKVIE